MLALPLLAMACGPSSTGAPMSVADASVDDASSDSGPGPTGSPAPGYTLFAPMGSTTTYLVDLNGEEVHAWSSALRPALSVYLLDDGSILRPGNSLAAGATNRFDAGGAGGRVERIAWDGSITWSYDVLTDTMRAHHDIEPLPNGHVLVVAWELLDEASAESAGRAPNRVDAEGIWPEAILEVAPAGASGTVVWEWHARDHFGAGASRIDANGGAAGSDFMHVNSVDYDAELDAVLLSSHGYDEVWVIDHGTTTLEASGSTGGARGHGGDLLYRWGNPASYGAASASDQKLFGQHDAQWVEGDVEGARHVTIFNNGLRRPSGNYSTVEEIALPLDDAGDFVLAGTSWGPATAYFTYAAHEPTTFYAQNISGAQRLPNGDTLVCAGTTGTMFEITSSGETVWSYTMPTFGNTPAGTLVFRATRYPPEHPAFAGRSLVPMGPIVP